MLKKIIDLFKTKREEMEPDVKREVNRLEDNLSIAAEWMQRSVTKSNEVKEHDECSEFCSSCGGTGYLKKDIRLLYLCKACFGAGSIYWIDRCLTASRVSEYEMKMHTQNCKNIHTLIYELKYEAMKIGAVALVEIKPMGPPNTEEIKRKLSSLNLFGGIRNNESE